MMKIKKTIVALLSVGLLLPVSTVNADPEIELGENLIADTEYFGFQGRSGVAHNNKTYSEVITQTINDGVTVDFEFGDGHDNSGNPGSTGILLTPNAGWTIDEVPMEAGKTYLYEGYLLVEDEPLPEEELIRMGLHPNGEQPVENDHGIVFDGRSTDSLTLHKHFYNESTGYFREVYTQGNNGSAIRSAFHAHVMTPHDYIGRSGRLHNFQVREVLNSEKIYE